VRWGNNLRAIPVSGATMKFTHNSYADASGTHLQGYVDAVPAKLIELFGEPEAGDEYKVSMAYTFEGDDGSVVTLYDWKATSLYGGTRLTPGALRCQTTHFHFHVGAHAGPVSDAFISWLTAKLEEPTAPTKATCTECKGLRKYVGFLGFPEPCRTCC